jgi:hypothetical protein
VLGLVLKGVDSDSLPAALLQYVTDGFAWIALAFLASSALALAVRRYRARRANPYARLRLDREPRFDMPRMRPEPHLRVVEDPLAPARAPREPVSRDCWSVELLAELDGAQFAALVTAYYEMRDFRVERVLSAVEGHADAMLYFRTLPDAVAILRCIAWTGAAIGVKPVRELQRIGAGHGVAKGIVHVAGECTPEARALARAERIQLVTGADLVASILTLPESARDALLALVFPPGGAVTER